MMEQIKTETFGPIDITICCFCHQETNLNSYKHFYNETMHLPEDRHKLYVQETAGFPSVIYNFVVSYLPKYQKLVHVRCLLQDITGLPNDIIGIIKTFYILQDELWSSIFKPGKHDFSKYI